MGRTLDGPARRRLLAAFGRVHKLDIIAGAQSGVVVLLGNGDGTFQPVVSDPDGKFISSLAVEDVNGDGNVDAVADSTSGLDVLGKGNGSFNPPVFYSTGVSAGGWPRSVVIADLDDDGKPALAAANYPDGTAAVILNSGSGAFSPAALYPTGFSNALSLAAADIKGDLKRDLISANGGSTVHILLGNGDGTFQFPLAYSLLPSFSNSITIADLNHDRRPDLLVLAGQVFVQFLTNMAALLRWLPPPRSFPLPILLSSGNPSLLERP
jgi:hypothetical protein